MYDFINHAEKFIIEHLQDEFTLDEIADCYPRDYAHIAAAAIGKDLMI